MDSSVDYLQRYFGVIHPPIAIGLALIIGVGALKILSARSWFAIYAPKMNARGVGLSAAVATGFAAAAILVDSVIGFPRDLNVPLPHALLFYPVMGFVAEVFLHLLPLTLLLVVLSRVFKGASLNKIMLASIAATAVVEPVFQVSVGPTGVPLLDGYVFLHVLAFGLAQLSIFRRFDFASMLVCRLVYYLYWHIIWGYFRLQWLF